jgi:hypothetical protein
VTTALVDRVRRLPPKMREALCAQLPPGALSTRRYDWRHFLARPEQIAALVNHLSPKISGPPPVVCGVRSAGVI